MIARIFSALWMSQIAFIDYFVRTYLLYCNHKFRCKKKESFQIKTWLASSLFD